MSSLYLNSSKRSGESEDPRSVHDIAGEESKGEEVTGYEGNDPLERGDERTAERGGEEGRREVRDGGEVREAWGGETNFCLFAAMVPFTSHPPHYLCSSRALHLLNSGQHVKPPGNSCSPRNIIFHVTNGSYVYKCPCLISHLHLWVSPGQGL